MDPLAARLIPQPATPRPVLVGFSGGLDSTVLLHLLAATPALHGGLRALHVDHGLHPDSGLWAEHCRHACDLPGIPLQIERVVVHEDGGGREAAARSARHAAFAGALRPGGVLALAHHLDDQAETFLLRALRASGPDGLAAMPPWRPHGTGWLWRPLLAQPRAALLDHARAHGLRWIEDPSNADTSLDRNFLRADVLPLLQRRWPAAAAGFARSAALCAESATLLQEEDARALAAVSGPTADLLDAIVLRQLPPARRARVLRQWVTGLGLPPLPAHGVERVGRELLDAPVDSQAAFAWAGARLRRWRHWLQAGRDRPALPGDWTAAWDGRDALALPGGGVLRLEGAARFDDAVRVRARRGGERLRLPGRTHHHALKKVLQDLGVPPWERARMPLLESAGGELLAAGDRVVAAPMQAWLRSHGARLVWDPDPLPGS